MHNEDDLASVEIPELHQIQDRAPDSLLIHSDKRSSRSGRDILNVLHLSRPSSPRTPNSATSTPSLGHAIEDEDLDELKEGLNYALGTKENEANWFPVNKLSKSTTQQREETSGDENSSFVNFTTDIPLNDLSPSFPTQTQIKTKATLRQNTW